MSEQGMTPDTAPATDESFFRSRWVNAPAGVEERGRVLAFSAIDNLWKGAAGQAVQNLNLMLGLDEEMGLA